MRLTSGVLRRGWKSPISTALEADWRDWLTTLFPDFATAAFAPHHELLWQWVWAIEPGVRPPPFVGIFARGGAKSTSAEMATVAVGARGTRQYGLYISETQDQADAHVASIGDLLESPEIESYYPALASRAVNKYGSSRGWRRNRLTTAAGFMVDAVGFDTAARGIKRGALRPDFLVIDDVDNQKDSVERVEKKIGVLTRGLLPVGSTDVAVLAVQNKIHDDSIFARFTDGRADFLANRIVVGPIPAVAGLMTEKRDGRDIITGGTPTWAGQSLATAQAQIDEWGLTAFLAEAQHDTSVLRERIYLMDWWRGRNRYDAADEKITWGVQARWISLDTAQKDKDTSDYSAAVVVELLPDYRIAVRDVWRDKLTFPDLLTAIEGMAARWNYDGKLQGIIIEDRSSGTSAAQSLNAASHLSVPVVAFLPNGSKVERARQASIWCARDCVLLPHPGVSVPWLYAFEGEITDFPMVANDDQADAFSQALIFCEHLLAAGFQARVGQPAEAA